MALAALAGDDVDAAVTAGEQRLAGLDAEAAVRLAARVTANATRREDRLDVAREVDGRRSRGGGGGCRGLRRHATLERDSGDEEEQPRTQKPGNHPVHYSTIGLARVVENGAPAKG